MKSLTLSIIILLLLTTDALAQSDSIGIAKSVTSLSFRPQLRALQVDVLKFFSIDLMVNLDLDLLKYGESFSFGLRPQLLHQGELAFDHCNCSVNHSLLGYGSFYMGDTGNGPDARATFLIGPGSVRSSLSAPVWENIRPVIGLELQVRLGGWFTATADYFVIPGHQESMNGYIPIGMRIGYVRW